MNDQTQTISFRVAANIADRLQEDGKGENLSRSEYARRLVLSALGSANTNELLAEIQEVKRQLHELTNQSVRSQAAQIKQAKPAKTPPALESLPTDLQEIRRTLGAISHQITQVQKSQAIPPNAAVPTELAKRLLGDTEQLKGAMAALATQLTRIQSAPPPKPSSSPPPAQSVENLRPLIAQQFSELHESFATAVAVLLVQVAKVAPDEARRWVTENLLKARK